MDERPGRSRPSLPPLRSSLRGPAGRTRRPTQTPTEAQLPPAVRVLGTSLPPTEDRRARHRADAGVAEGADGRLHSGPPFRPPSHMSRVQIRATREGRERLPGREVLDAERDCLKLGPRRCHDVCECHRREPRFTRPCSYGNRPLRGGSRGRRGTASPAFFLAQ